MALYSTAYLKNIKATTTLNESQQMFSETKRLTSFDIFLSHSFLDRDIVEALYVDLSKQGYSVYVDWIVDPHLDRSNVTRETAMLVRSRLASSRSLILAFSMNAAMSKWMPWELGYVDAKTSRCAILPVAEGDNPPKSFRQVEYLSLYPFISRVKDTNQRMRLWAVQNERTYVLLEDFIQGKQPFTHDINIY